MPEVRCSACMTPLEIDSIYLGRQVQCGACGATFIAKEDVAPVYSDHEREGDPWESDEEPEVIPKRRRRSRSADFDYAAEKVRGPATGLQVVGWIGVVISVLQFVVAVLFPILAVNMPAPPPGQPGGQNPQDAVMASIVYVVQGAVILGISIVILIGAGKLKRLESQTMATVSAVLALLPCFSPCCLLGLPFGIMAITAMNDPEVAAAFEASRYRNSRE